MWFIFPQMKGLGSSPTAQRFAISSLEEGAAYLEHPVLGRRLEKCTALVGPKVLITQPEKPWEKGVIHNNYPVTEGPTALYHEGRTFIVYSASNTMSAANYCLGLLTYAGGDPLQARSWVKTGPVFRSDLEHDIFSPGRATFALSRDGKTYWLLYHAKSRPEITMDGRSIRLQIFRWGADGMPEFGVPRPNVPIQ